MSEGEWFAPKRFGIGAGMPIAWQGWALMLAYVGAITGLSILLLPRHWSVWAAVVVIATGAVAAISVRHSRGGWKWRSGAD